MAGIDILHVDRHQGISRHVLLGTLPPDLRDSPGLASTDLLTVFTKTLTQAGKKFHFYTHGKQDLTAGNGDFV